MQISLSNFIAYGIIASCLSIAVFNLIQIELIWKHRSKWMNAFNKDDEEGMKRYDSRRKSLIDNWKLLTVIYGIIFVGCFSALRIVVGI